MSSESTLKFKDPLYAFLDCKDENVVEKRIEQRKKVSKRNKKDHQKRVNSSDRFEQMKRSWGKTRQKKILKAQMKKHNNDEKKVHNSFRENWPSYHTLFKMGEQQGWKCAISGIPFDFDETLKRKERLAWPSIDRIDSNKGYVLSNIWLVCIAVNYGKNQFGLAQYLNFSNFKTNITEKVLSDLSKGVEPTHNNSLKTASIEGL